LQEDLEGLSVVAERRHLFAVDHIAFGLSIAPINAPAMAKR
jgi:hypothetical protein